MLLVPAESKWPLLPAPEPALMPVRKGWIWGVPSTSYSGVTQAPALGPAPCGVCGRDACRPGTGVCVAQAASVALGTVAFGGSVGFRRSCAPLEVAVCADSASDALRKSADRMLSRDTAFSCERSPPAAVGAGGRKSPGHAGRKADRTGEAIDGAGAADARMRAAWLDGRVDGEEYAAMLRGPLQASFTAAVEQKRTAYWRYGWDRSLCTSASAGERTVRRVR